MAPPTRQAVATGSVDAVDVFDMGGGDGPRVPSDRILTVPNAVSLARLLVLPWLYWLVVDRRFVVAVLVAGAFAATDWIDGYLARRLDQVTRLGQQLDPVSDRLFVVVLLVALVVAEVVPLPLALVLVVRDVLLLAGGAVLLARGQRPPAVTRLSKATTFVLMSSLPVLVLAAHLLDRGQGAGEFIRQVGLLGAVVGAVMYWVVGLGYVRDVMGRPRA